MEMLPDPDILLDPPKLPEIPLPKGWSEYTFLAMLHVIALARIIVLNVANWPSDVECDGLRLRVENDRLRSEISFLQREIKVKDSRFSRIDPKKRPTYNALERFEILALKAIRGWSNEKIAKRFHVTVQTVINWMSGVECGEESTVSFTEKPNRYPDFVRYVVQQFKSYCPMLGRHKIADILCRAGLHLSASTVKRIIDQPPMEPAIVQNENPPAGPTVQAWYVNHVWSVDLTVVPSCDGMWTPWPPNALTQVHPYSWYVMVAIDHFSRRIMGFEVFEQQPTAAQVIAAMDRICTENNVKPKHIVTDQGVQFISGEFKAWCKSNDTKNRYGAAHKHGSIAVTERVIKTNKDGCTRRILVPILQADMIKETQLFFDWYNKHRPHMFLRGKTPNEMYFGRHAANAKPRIETRPLAKHSTPCASPKMCIAGKAGARVRVRLEFLEGRLHLPILKIERI